MSSIIFEQLSTSIHIHISYSNIFPTLPLNHSSSKAAKFFTTFLQMRSWKFAYWNFQEFSRDRVKGFIDKRRVFRRLLLSPRSRWRGKGGKSSAVTDEPEKVELKIESSLEIRARWLCAKNDLSRNTSMDRMVLANEFSPSGKFRTMIIFYTFCRNSKVCSSSYFS